MAGYHKTLSLANVTASTGVGAAVALPWATRRFVGQVRLAGTTEAVVRLQGSLGAGTWVNLGSAASTISSTHASMAFTSTSAMPFDKVRMILVSRTTSTGTEQVSGWCNGVIA
jgi:hypothetical protein